VIIQVSEHRREVSKEPIHQPLECLSCIHETKGMNIYSNIPIGVRMRSWQCPMGPSWPDGSPLPRRWQRKICIHWVWMTNPAMRTLCICHGLWPSSSVGYRRMVSRSHPAWEPSVAAMTRENLSSTLSPLSPETGTQLSQCTACPDREAVPLSVEFGRDPTEIVLTLWEVWRNAVDCVHK
jgi:hypothetical protein